MREDRVRCDRSEAAYEVLEMSEQDPRMAIKPLAPPMRLMMTPGPSSIDPRVYRALSVPVVGPLVPWFQTCVDETQLLMRQVCQTENTVMMPLSLSRSHAI